MNGATVNSNNTILNNANINVNQIKKNLTLNYNNEQQKTTTIQVDNMRQQMISSPLPVIKPDTFLNAADHSLVSVYCFVKNFIG